MRAKIYLMSTIVLLGLLLFAATKQFITDFYWRMANQDGKELNKTIGYLEKCIAIDDNNALFHFSLGRTYLRRGLVRFRKPIERNKWLRRSIFEFQKAIELEPSHSDYHFHLGISYGNLAYPPHFYCEVIQNSFTRTAMLNPTDIRHLSSMKEYYLNKYNRIKSIGMNTEEIGSINYKKYEALLKENYQFYFQLNLIRNLLEAGRLDEAIEGYHKILEKNPNLSKEMYDSVLYFQKKGKNRYAVKILNKALVSTLNR
jgi:tetratricopeptide (TPR) repeat protein